MFFIRHCFEGVDRFQANVSNLGGLMENIDLKITGWEDTADALETSWRFSCILQVEPSQRRSPRIHRTIELSIRLLS